MFRDKMNSGWMSFIGKMLRAEQRQLYIGYNTFYIGFYDLTDAH